MSKHQHIDAHFDAELRQLERQLLEMARLVERQVSAAMLAFARRDLEQSRAVQRGDREVNDLEREIDERCVSLIVRRQPAASDLRLVAAVLKIVTDLERIGDLAVDLAGRAEALAHAPPPELERLSALTDAALDTLRGSLQTFVQRDPERARDVIAAGPQRNRTAAAAIDHLRRAMAGDVALVPDGTLALLATLHVQRMAAHAQNIAEMAIYAQSGEDVRHAT